MNLFLKRYLSIVVLSLVIFAACEDFNDLDTTPPSGENISADFSAYAAVGNSITAGFQSNALYQDAQEVSFPSLLASKLGIEDFEQPLISNPGVGDPGRIELTNLQSQETRFNSNQGSPINAGIGRPYNNLGVPGAKLADYLNQGGSLNENPLYPLIINNGDPSNPLPSMHAAVEALQPTFVTFWLGNNDILGYVTSGGLRAFTNPGEFQTQYVSSISQIQGLNSDPTVAVFNIPAVSSIPFATTVGPQFQETIEGNDQVPGIVVQQTFYEATPGIGASENRNPAGLIQKTNLDNPDSALVLLTARDFLPFVGVSANPQAPTFNEQAVTAILNYWRGFIVQAGQATEEQAAQFDQAQIENIMTQITIGQYEETFGAAAAAQFAAAYPGFDFNQPFGLSAQSPFPNQFVLDGNEISITNTVTGIFNSVIASQGDIQIDVNAFFSGIVQDGTYVDPETGETFAPVIGSLFSLDGVHPSNKAHAILTNQIINALNSETGTSVSQINLNAIPEGIPVASGGS